MKIWFEEGGGGLQKDFYWRGWKYFKKGGLDKKGVEN